MGLLDDVLPQVVKEVMDVVADGDTASLIKRSRGDYDPVTGIGTEGTTTASIPLTPMADVDFRDVNGETVLLGDQKMSIPAQGLEFVPDTTCVVVVGATEWKVVEVLPIYSGSLVCSYILYLRR